ncbi:MAG: MMPL family transporter, partial [Desulfobacterales bacterium]
MLPAPRKKQNLNTSKRYRENVGAILARWVSAVSRIARWIVVLSCVVTVALLYYTVKHLGMNTDTAEMLSESLPFRQFYTEFKTAFPQFDDVLLIVIEAETPGLAQDASTALAARLADKTNLFETIYLPGDNVFFQKNGLLFLSPAALEDLSDNLAKIQPFLGKLTRDQNLRGFFTMLKAVSEAVMQGEELDLSLIFEHIRKAVDAILAGRNYTLSWQELMLAGDVSPDDQRRFIMTQPRLDYNSAFPAETALREVQRLIQQMQLTDANGVRVRLTGDAALEYEELQSVTRGAGIAGTFALVLVGIVLFVGLRSPRLVAATLITLIIGLTWTAWFASVAVGYLNLISVAFAVLYIGLSVDYGIHFCLRYKELIQQSFTHIDALCQTARDVGSSLLFCCVSTAIGFYAFIPTAFTGIAELGIISGTGMFISLIANLTLLPALLTLMPLSSKANAPVRGRGFILKKIFSVPEKHRRIVRFSALVIG